MNAEYAIIIYGMGLNGLQTLSKWKASLEA